MSTIGPKADQTISTSSEVSTSSIFNKVHKSAVCIIPPKQYWDTIQAIREKHDKAFQRWPPHINLLYPFIPEEYFADAKRRLNLGSIDPFEITFRELSCFTHGRNSTLILKPKTVKNFALKM